MNAAGSRLAAVYLADTTATNLFTAVLVTEVTRVQVFLPADDDSEVVVYHVPAGVNAPGNAHRILRGGHGALGEAASGGSGITLARGDSIWAKAGTANKATVTLYGVTADIAKA